MPRVAEEEVLKLIDTTKSDVCIFIDVANNLVEEHLVGVVTSTALLENIELYLAAHFLALTEERGGLIRTGLGESAETLQDLYSEGLRSTRFGQQALALDYTGTLAALTLGKLSAQFRIV